MIGSACRRSLLLAHMWACERHPYHVRIASRPRHTGSPRFCSRSREIGPLQQSSRQVGGLGRATA
jgi:hypothetical protein